MFPLNDSSPNDVSPNYIVPLNDSIFWVEFHNKTQYRQMYETAFVKWLTYVHSQS
jgi:hypothetical protein